MEDHGHKELKNTFSFMGNINDELWYLFLPPPLYHCTATGLESANCLLEYIATISFYGKPTPKMICLNYKLQARRRGAVEYEMWAPGDEEYHHPSQRVVEGPPRQAGHTRHLQHHGVSTVL